MLPWPAFPASQHPVTPRYMTLHTHVVEHADPRTRADLPHPSLNNRARVARELSHHAELSTFRHPFIMPGRRSRMRELRGVGGAEGSSPFS